MLSISDLVRLATKNRKTITKRVQGGRYPNAVQDDTGLKAW